MFSGHFLPRAVKSDKLERISKSAQRDAPRPCSQVVRRGSAKPLLHRFDSGHGLQSPGAGMVYGQHLKCCGCKLMWVRFPPRAPFTSAMTFTRTKENFTCEHCGTAIIGNGYTNHCPHCLWSKHVDVSPGDRAAECRGMMDPIRVETDGGGYAIIHRCQRCGVEKKNRVAAEDEVSAITAIMKLHSGT